jgi:hypothetical protein
MRSLNTFNVCFSQKLPQRERFVGRVDELVKRVVAALPLDAAADQMAARYLRSRLPLFDSTAVGSGAGAGSDAADEDNPREQLEASDRVQVRPRFIHLSHCMTG